MLTALNSVSRCTDTSRQSEWNKIQYTVVALDCYINLLVKLSAIHY